MRRLALLGLVPAIGALAACVEPRDLPTPMPVPTTDVPVGLPMSVLPCIDGIDPRCIIWKHRSGTHYVSGPYNPKLAPLRCRYSKAEGDTYYGDLPSAYWPGHLPGQVAVFPTPADCPLYPPS